MKKLRMIFPMLFLLLCFSFLLPDLCSQPQEKAPQDVKRPMLRKQFLDLTDAQEKQLKEMREEWMAESRAFQEAMRTKIGDLRRLMEDPEANAEKIEKLRDEMFNMRQEHEKKSYLHRKEVRKVLTPEQMKKLGHLRRGLMMRQGMWGRGFFGPQRFRGPGMLRGYGWPFRRWDAPLWRRGMPWPGRLFLDR